MPLENNHECRASVALDHIVVSVEVAPATGAGDLFY